MSKLKNVTYTFPIDLIEEFNNICEDEGYNKSKIVEKQIRAWVSSKKNSK